MPAYHGPSLRGLRVLVVDDDPDALDLIATILRRAEAEAVLCSSPPEALAALRSWKPHVLVSDIEMPGEDGYSLIRKVRELAGSEGGQIPAVALTAYGRPEDRVRSLSAGYSMHVAKPVDPVELGVIVANLADGRSPRRAARPAPGRGFRRNADSGSGCRAGRAVRARRHVPFTRNCPSLDTVPAHRRGAAARPRHPRDGRPRGGRVHRLPPLFTDFRRPPPSAAPASLASRRRSRERDDDSASRAPPDSDSGPRARARLPCSIRPTQSSATGRSGRRRMASPPSACVLFRRCSAPVWCRSRSIFRGHGLTSVDSHHALARHPGDPRISSAASLSRSAPFPRGRLPRLSSSRTCGTARSTRPARIAVAHSRLGRAARRLGFDGFVLSDDSRCRRSPRLRGAADAARRFPGAGGDLALICRSAEARTQRSRRSSADIAPRRFDPARPSAAGGAIRGLVDAAGPRPDLSVMAALASSPRRGSGGDARPSRAERAILRAPMNHPWADRRAFRLAAKALGSAGLLAVTRVRRASGGGQDAKVSRDEASRPAGDPVARASVGRAADRRTDRRHRMALRQTPYAASTLELYDDREVCSVDFGADCVTFFELALAFARTLKPRAF